MFCLFICNFAVGAKYLWFSVSLCGFDPLFQVLSHFCIFCIFAFQIPVGYLPLCVWVPLCVCVCVCVCLIHSSKYFVCLNIFSFPNKYLFVFVRARACVCVWGGGLIHCARACVCVGGEGLIHSSNITNAKLFTPHRPP